jgi:U3 small nucleolar RNA-associated protein 21
MYYVTIYESRKYLTPGRVIGTMATMTVEVDDEETTRPSRKRVRSSLTRAGTAPRAVVSEEIPNSRRLFAPFRALGLITNQVPFALQLRAVKGSTEGPRLHILTCMGNSWALWEGEKMTLLFVGE